MALLESDIIQPVRNPHSTFCSSNFMCTHQSFQFKAYRKLSISFGVLASFATASAAAWSAGSKSRISPSPASPGGLKGSSSKYRSVHTYFSICRLTSSLVGSPSRFPRLALLITRKISPFRKYGLLLVLESLRARTKSSSGVIVCCISS